MPEGSNHFALLDHVLALTPTPIGTAVELGVGSGASARRIAAVMPVLGFDSFQGLPEDWRPGFGKGRFAHPPPVLANVIVVIGLFADTLPVIDWQAFSSKPGGIGLVHFDADLYSSTATALRWIGSWLRSGCYLVFDEFHSYPGCEQHEQRAWREYAAARPDLAWDVIGHGHEQWAIRLR